MFVCVLIFILQFCAYCFAQTDVAGCGGFILSGLQNSEGNIDFSSIRVKLLTLDGSTKEQTEAAPTGYYYLPIYDKGNYKIVVSGRDGWNFEPSEVFITISEDNKCLKSKSVKEEDINFKLTGFTLSAKVVGKNCLEAAGPHGVIVRLFKEKGVDVIAEATSDSNGRVEFSNIAPGLYSLRPHHPNWKFVDSELKVKVDWDNIALKTAVVVTGYQIKGRVSSQGEPVSNVQFLLYPNSSKHNVELNCTIPAPFNNEKEKPLCVQTSDEKGSFLFSEITCGTYKLVPYYKGHNTTFDVSPKHMVVTVSNGDAILSQEFQVKGFSLGGRVVHANGKPVADARVWVNNIQKSQTDENGYYILDELSSASYTIHATKEHIHFKRLENYRITPSTGKIADIVASEYDICGRVLISHFPASTASSKERKVVLSRKNVEVASKTSDSNGNFCFQAAPGEYTVHVQVSKEEENGGLVLAPKQATIQLESDAIQNLLFTQTRVTVSGVVKCLQASCDPQIAITMQNLELGWKVTSGLSPASQSNSFLFRDVLPGSYTISISKEDYCWNRQHINVSVSEEDISNLQFDQIGYLVVVNAKHAAQLEVVSSKSNKLVQNISIAAGRTNLFCLQEAGDYNLKPTGCFQYATNSVDYNTANPRTIELEPTNFKLTGHLLLKKNKGNNVAVLVHDLQTDLQVEISASPSSKKDDYVYNYWVPLSSVNHRLIITPKSTELLFYPQSMEYIVTDLPNCVEMQTFEGREGMFIQGTIKPALPNVLIQAFADSQEDALVTVHSQADGKYSIGPLYDDKKYSLKAQLDGYTIQQSDDYNFLAHKLGRLIVTVQDSSSSTGIASVLLSLSSHLYRSNNVTNGNGSFTFSNLQPGDYHLKALLKEYNFEPPSISIKLADGEDKSVTILGKRVAYSCFGSVKSVLGHPEKLVTVEAHSINGDYEHTQSDVNGNFRLRGLLPNTAYTISINNRLSDERLERASPATITATVRDQDIHNVEFIVFRKPAKLDLSVSVHTPDNSKYLSTIQVTIRKEGESNPTTVTAGPSNYVEFMGLSKGSYVLTVKSTLSQQIYTITNTELPITLTDTNLHVNANVTIALKSENLQELSSAPFFAVVVGALIVLSLFYRDNLTEFIQSLRENKKRANTTKENTNNDWLPQNSKKKEKPKPRSS